MDIDVKATLRKALGQLQRQRKEIDEQIAAIDRLTGQRSRAGRRSSSQSVRLRKRRRMSAAARRAISKRMKAYWAKKGAAKSK